jgi:hypothetical protein
MSGLSIRSRTFFCPAGGLDFLPAAPWFWLFAYGVGLSLFCYRSISFAPVRGGTVVVKPLWTPTKGFSVNRSLITRRRRIICRRMDAPVVVKVSDVTRYIALGLFVTAVLLFTDPFALQASEEPLDHRVDAPMSRSRRRIGQISQDERVQFADDITLQAAVDLLVRHAFLRPTIHVDPSARITAHPNHCNGP